jgi:hypothetical protein
MSLFDTCYERKVVLNVNNVFKVVAKCRQSSSVTSIQNTLSLLLY